MRSIATKSALISRLRPRAGHVRAAARGSASSQRGQSVRRGSGCQLAAVAPGEPP